MQYKLSHTTQMDMMRLELIVQDIYRIDCCIVYLAVMVMTIRDGPGLQLRLISSTSILPSCVSSERESRIFIV